MDLNHNGKGRALSLQMRYNLLHMTYWICMVCFMGFNAIVLGGKGLNNTEIGVSVGSASLLSILVSPALSSLASRIKGLSLQRLLSITIVIVGLDYLFLSFVSIPVVVLMVLFIAALSTMISMMPLLSQISMDYIAQGKSVHFGMGRGTGSVSYAAGAVLLTQMLRYVPADFLSVVFSISAVLFCLVAGRMPCVYVQKEGNAPSTSKENDSSAAAKTSPFALMVQYPMYFLLLAGMALVFSCQSALATYLIRLVESLGGTASQYGAAVFCMAASELPFLMAAPKLIKRFGTMPLVAAGALFYLVRNCGAVLAANLPVMLICLMFQGASFGLLTAVITYHVSDMMAPEQQVMGQTMFTVMTNGLGSAMGNFIGGWIIDHFGLAGFTQAVVSASALGVAIMLTAVVAAVGLPRWMQRKAAGTPAVIKTAH